MMCSLVASEAVRSRSLWELKRVDRVVFGIRMPYRASLDASGHLQCFRAAEPQKSRSMWEGSLHWRPAFSLSSGLLRALCAFS